MKQFLQTRLSFINSASSKQIPVSGFWSNRAGDLPFIGPWPRYPNYLNFGRKNSMIKIRYK
jgi:hypothetical protein